jgi:outer membrane protein
MRLFSKGLLLAASIAFSGLAAAQNIAVFSPEKALFATQAAVQLGQQLSQQLKPQSERLQAIGQELQALQKRHKEDQSLMSADELKQLELQINQQSREFQKLQQYLNNAKRQTEEKFLSSMRSKLDSALQTYIEANDLALIVNSSAVVYSRSGVDITTAITAMLDQE